MSFIKFLKEFKNTSTGLMAIGIFATFTILGGYRLVIKPAMDKRQRLQAESFANYIYDQENMRSTK